MKRVIWSIVALALLATPALGQEMKDGPDRRVEADEIDKYILEKKVFFLDVREPKELEELGTIEGYYNIPLGQLETRLGELPKDKLILTAWNGGGRAARAAALLAEKGYKVAGFCGLSQYKGKKINPKVPK